MRLSWKTVFAAIVGLLLVALAAVFLVGLKNQSEGKPFWPTSPSTVVVDSPTEPAPEEKKTGFGSWLPWVLFIVALIIIAYLLLRGLGQIEVPMDLRQQQAFKLLIRRGIPFYTHDPGQGWRPITWAEVEGRDWIGAEEYELPVTMDYYSHGNVKGHRYCFAFFAYPWKSGLAYPDQQPSLKDVHILTVSAFGRKIQAWNHVPPLAFADVAKWLHDQEYGKKSSPFPDKALSPFDANKKELLLQATDKAYAEDTGERVAEGLQ